MTSMFCYLHLLLRIGNKGATTIEYGLVAAVISIVVISGFEVAGGSLTSTFIAVVLPLCQTQSICVLPALGN